MKLAKPGLIECDHEVWALFILPLRGNSEVLFTENETNLERLYEVKNTSPYVKDAFHNYLIEGRKQDVNPEQIGTKATPHLVLSFEPKETKVLRFRLVSKEEAPKSFLRILKPFFLNEKGRPMLSIVK